MIWSGTSHPHAHLHAQLGLISASVAPSAVIYHRHRRARPHALDELVALLLPPPSSGYKRRRVGHDLSGLRQVIVFWDAKTARATLQ
jgi:hypothetical protein